MFRKSKTFFLWMLFVCLTTASKPSPANRKTKPAKESYRPLHERGYEEILKSYTFVGDFSQKAAEREVGDELFWRYPYILPKIEFPIEEQIEPKVEMPATVGGGRAVDHLNLGRVLYLEGKFDEAKSTWLGGRARYGQDYPFHRRNDYFIGMSFLNIALRNLKNAGGVWSADDVKITMSNAGTFLSWAFIVKTEQADALIDKVTPKGLYNLAAIYWRYNRYAAAFGAADQGLNFLRRSGRKEYRPQLHRIVAEAHIRNRTYLEAVQQLDTAIRQDHQPAQAAAMFARVGDIYFDLNNYELAEDSYALGAKIDEDMAQINPAQLILRGESLFWLGRFSEAQKILNFAIEGSHYRSLVSDMPPNFVPWAKLRLADSYLARKEYDKAKLEYFKVAHQYQDTEVGKIARVREACLELPYYRGNNVMHARKLLEESKTVGLPPLVIELAWACQVGSYTDRERTQEMLDRVKAFAASYPESKFLQSFIEPVREVQASRINDFFKTKDIYRALSFFEKNRKNLFPKVSDDLAVRLFTSYLDVFSPEKAQEFLAAYHKLPDTDLKAIREALVAAEMVERKKGRIWERRNAYNAKELAKRKWRIDPGEPQKNYVRRMMVLTQDPEHLQWLDNLAQHWAKSDPSYICDLEYPILSRRYESDSQQGEKVLARLSEHIKLYLPDLFKSDESCAVSLLDLEGRILQGRWQDLAKRYIERKSWALAGAYLHTYWTMSEHIYDGGEKAAAEEMWTVIRDRGPRNAPEVQFAKARLDKTRTEVEKLWD